MWNGVLCGLLAGAMWGMVFIVPELLAAFSPVELAVGRYIAYGAIATGLMLPRLRGLMKRLDRSDCGALVRHALAGNIVYYMLLALGVKLAGVAPTSLIIGLLPITVTLLGRKDHGAIPLSQLALPLLVVGAGIACINVDVFLHARASGASPGATLLGVLCAFGALLCWSWYALDFAIWHGEVTGAAGMASGRNWTAFWITNALLALGASVIGNHLWNIASRRVPVTLSGQLILFETLFALLYGFVYHRQFPRMLEMAAIVLLIAGVVWAVRMHAVQPVAEQTAAHG
ncbi:EamA family transporter [Massilia sp. CCM 8695]|uniref:EamA family transporter n=1 Tax=Massilia frigida TaxID=2609281 RepID=A0ABX0NDU4_9BURK|nr:DMT family transporter [Massilia frigida]NHZ83289.1 EamA family transporter [Massilia frigida]